MKFQDISWVLERGRDFPGAPEFFEFNDQLAINHKIALPLHSVSSVYNGQVEIEVNDSAGNTLGVLCLCKHTDIDLSMMTETQLICYLSEIEKEYYGEPYKFQNNYLVVDIDVYDDYNKNYLSTSFLWGGFVHLENGTKHPYTQTVTSIVAVPNIKLPTDYHVETGIRGISQPFAFERYLKFYHLLELLFDYDTVEKIKNLPDDLMGVGQILSKYDRNEVERLKYVIENRCQDYQKVAIKLNSAFVSDEFQKKVKTIFFEYGKEHNPFRDEREEKFDQLMSRGGFTEENAREVKLAKNEKEYEKLVFNTAIYWLYRIRCSIAHSRIGEYVMTMDDEKFIVEFAEPLLKEILVQAFVK